jgi:hypothetical protein
VTAGAVTGPFAHVTGDKRNQAGMEGDPRGAATATCKTAGFAYTGSNPVPATPPLSCGKRVSLDADRAFCWALPSLRPTRS